MDIIGSGIDIVEVERFQRVLFRYGERFLSRIYTVCERDYCNERRNFYEHLAARFCAKEAVRKAFGNYSQALRWRDVEVENDTLGKPEVRLSGNARKIAIAAGINRILVTISHSRNYAVAQAILLK